MKRAVDELYTFLNLLEERPYNAELVILGDFNVSYVKTSTTDFKMLKEFEPKVMLSQLIDSPTRITNTVKSTIDLIFYRMTRCWIVCITRLIENSTC